VNIQQVQRAMETLEDVFTPAGNAGVISNVIWNDHDKSHGFWEACVTGVDHGDDTSWPWFDIKDLTAKEDIVDDQTTQVRE